MNADVMIRSVLAQTSTSEEAELQRWRAASETNEREYQEVVRVWTHLSLREITTRPPRAEEIVARASVRARAQEPGSNRGTKVWRWLPLAAAALLVLTLGGTDLLRRSATGDSRLLEPVMLSTGGDQTRMLELSDGTIVHVAPNSRLAVVSDPERRVVRLEGRAFFGVAERADWPFVVRGRFGEAEVLGTRFEFASEGDDARVVVVDGRVAFSSGDGEAEITAGQLVQASQGTQPMVQVAEDITQLLAWMGSALVFHDTPLSQAAREIEVRYGRQVEVRGAELAQRTVSGGFENQSFQQVVSTLCRVIAAECSITSDGAVIEDRP